MSTEYLPIPISDTLPSRSRGVITRKKSASAKRRYTIDVYETHSGEWMSLVPVVGPGVQDTGLGVPTEDELQTILHTVSDIVLEHEAIMSKCS